MLFAATEGITAPVDDAISFKVTFVTIRRGAGIRAIQALNQVPKRETLQILEHVSRKYWKCFQKVQNPYKVLVKREEINES